MAAQRSAGGFLTVAAGLVAVGYFLIHGLTGEAGLAAWTETRRELAALEARHAWLSVHVADLEDRARRLREPTLDLDYLEERARDVAMVARADDVIIPANALDAALAGPRRTRPSGARWGGRGGAGRDAAPAQEAAPRGARLGDRAYTSRLVARP